MAISIDLAPDEQRQLEEKARASGRDIADFVRELIRRELNGGAAAPGEAGEKTFDEILAPIREGWRQSGMTEDEITTLFEETRDEVRRERRARKATP